MTRPTGEQATEVMVAEGERAARARARILKGFILLFLAGLGFALVALWFRDTSHIRRAEGALGPFHHALQASLDASGRLPPQLPKSDPEGRALSYRGISYAPVDDIRALREFDGPVMVAHTWRVGTGLRTSGRAVLICDQGRCSIRWLSDTDFADWSKRQTTWVREHQRQRLERGPQLP